MAVSKSQQAAVNRYVKKNYARLSFTIQKAAKDPLEAAAKANLRAAYAEAVVTYLDKGTAEQTISIPKAETDATVTYADLGVTGKDGSVELEKDNTKITVKFNPDGTVDSITCS